MVFWSSFVRLATVFPCRTHADRWSDFASCDSMPAPANTARSLPKVPWFWKPPTLADT